MRALLLSGYDAASHRRWRTQLVDQFDDIDWTSISLPNRRFFWRIRSNALSFATVYEDELRADYDLVVATSMVDLASLKGFAESLANVPSVVYFHENQFAYPTPPYRDEKEPPKWTNLFAAHSADAIVFNSQYNLDSFLEGVSGFADDAPDGVPSDLTERLRAKATVVPVPLESDCFDSSPAREVSSPLRLVWNHRWEYDKGPERLEAALERLVSEDISFSIDIVGQQFGNWPDAFDRIKKKFGAVISTFGYVESRRGYLEILERADVVISTALHEFQGLAVLEAVARGCRPCVPDRLAYRDFFEKEWRYESYVDSPEKDGESLAAKLSGWACNLEELRQASEPNIEHLSWEHLRTRYADLFEQLTE
jgi:glycosyltransferase involved in cell wall biosynthesis